MEKRYGALPNSQKRPNLKVTECISGRGSKILRSLLTSSACQCTKLPVNLLVGVFMQAKKKFGAFFNKSKGVLNQGWNVWNFAMDRRRFTVTSFSPPVTIFWYRKLNLGTLWVTFDLNYSIFARQGLSTESWRKPQCVGKPEKLMNHRDHLFSWQQQVIITYV